MKATRVNAKKKKATVYLDLAEGAFPETDDAAVNAIRLPPAVVSSDGKLAAWKGVWTSGDPWTNLAARITGETCLFEHAALGEVSVKVGAKGAVTVSNKGRAASGTMLVTSFEADGAGGIALFEAEVCVRLPAKVVNKKTTAQAAVVSFMLRWDGAALTAE